MYIIHTSRVTNTFFDIMNLLNCTHLINRLTRIEINITRRNSSNLF